MLGALKHCGGICALARRAIVYSMLWVPLGLLGYWWWLDYAIHDPWVIYGEAQVVVEPSTADSVQVHWQYTVTRNCPRAIELWLIGEFELLVWRHHGKTSNQAPGNRVRTTKHSIMALPPGRWAFRSISTGYCNPLRSQTVVSQDVVFDVQR